MRKGPPHPMVSGTAARRSIWLTAVILLTAAAGGAYWIRSLRPSAVPTIALIPQTAGAMLGDVEHFGATVAAEKLKYHLYWNAPTSENDLAGQVSLIDKVTRGRYQGLVLAPNHPLAVLAPLRRALAAGLTVVVVSAPLDLPAGNKLGYIVNDDEKMGELAAAEVARLIHGRGSLALIGIAHYAPGVMLRVRGAERLLAQQFPNISVVSRLGYAYNSTRAEEVTSSALDSNSELKAVLSFTAAATRGAHAALKGRKPGSPITLVGCEQDFDLIGYVGNGEVAAVVAENTYLMGYQAVQSIAASAAGKPLTARSVVPPLLITKENLNSAPAGVFTALPR